MLTNEPIAVAAIEQLGGYVQAAEKLGIPNPSVVWNWQKRKSIPADQVIAVERLTGIPRQKLRPDIFGEAA